MNHYEVLEVSSSASQSEIKSAYRKLVKRIHPDINPDPSAARQMISVNEAYEVLSNVTSRNLYDLFLQGVPVKTDLEKDEPAQRYREEYLRKRERQERDQIIFLVKLKTRFYRYQRMANMLFFGIAILFTVDYYYQPKQSFEVVNKIIDQRFETKIELDNGYNISTSKEFIRDYKDSNSGQILVKYSLFFDTPAKIQTKGGSNNFIVGGTIYTFRNFFSIVILVFSAVVVKNKEYNDFRLSCGLVPGFFILFLFLFVLSQH